MTSHIKPANEQIQKMEIVNRFLIGKTPEEIAEDMELSTQMVKYYLAQDSAQDYLAKSASNKEVQLHLKRIDRAGSMMDTLLNRIEDFIANEEFTVEKRKDSHVALVKDVLLNKLPTSINKAIGTAININLWWTTSSNTTEHPLAKLVKGLDPEQTLLFRQVIDKLMEHIEAGRLFVIREMLKELENLDEPILNGN